MPEQLKGLTDNDIVKLQRLLDDHGNGTLFSRPQFSLPITRESGHIFATAYNTIPAAASDLEPGKGEVKVLKHLVETDPAGKLQQTGEIIKVYNPASKAYNDGDIVILQREARDGQYWIIPQGGGTDVIHFELMEDLTIGSSAKAMVLKLSEIDVWIDNAGDRVQVADWYQSPGMWAGKIGYRGLAIPRGNDYTDPGESESESDDTTRVQYDVVWMERIASWIVFRAYEQIDPDTNTFRAYVFDYDHQGIDPREEGEDTVIIRAPFSSFQDVVVDAYGHALYHHVDGEYQVISVDRVALFATAELNGACCGSGTPSIDQFTVVVHGQYWMPPPGFPITVATNPRGHAGADGAKVLLMRSGLKNSPGDNFDWNWEIVDIQKVTRTCIVEQRINTDGDLECKTATIYGEACAGVSDWTLQIEGTNC
ncbi:hypothetical protein [Anatilimnocola floriformis]|uniref:hypothetical protein n=1 Tax=Anatilimnocola floriformis TaxID=2948575 RepID=UPI0020C535FC|nr:hypothetical protein [Anatilimnocola floriformis]